MFRWLRPPPWPPELAPGETVLLEGAASNVRFLLFMAALFFVFVLTVYLLAQGVDRIFADLPDDGSGGRSFLWTMALLTGWNYLQMRRNAHWMLTSQRFIQQAKGAIPRSEIGSIRATWYSSVRVSRTGPDELLKGEKFSLDYLRDAQGVRDALERLK